MNRGWKWLLVAILLAAAGGVAWMLLLPREAKESAVEECSRESEFLVPLTAPASQVIDLPELELTANGFGCDVYGSDGVEYTVSGYPDVLDPYHLTEVRVESNACAVYGICVGDPVADGEKTLETWGYRGEDSILYGWVYRKKDVAVELAANEDGIIRFIRVMVDVTNKENVCF